MYTDPHQSPRREIYPGKKYSWRRGHLPAESEIDSLNAVNFDGYHIACVDPTIAYCIGQYQPESKGFAPPLPGGQQLDAIIEHLSWYCGTDGIHGTGLHHIGQRYSSQSNDGILRLVAVNTDAEESARLAAGVNGFQCNRSIHIRENQYVAGTTDILYDAIYIARLVAFKRIPLVGSIPRVRLLAGGYGDNGDNSVLEWARTHVDLELGYLSPQDVSKEIGLAVCGLALSGEEGVMRANTEYLLCGRPVVTTASLGGRDMLHDDYNSICVEPDEKAVACAVEEFKEDQRNPGRIRSRAIAMLNGWRYRYCRKLSDLRLELGGDEISPEQFYFDLFVDPAGARARFIPTRTENQQVFDKSSFAVKECEFRLRGSIELVESGQGAAIVEAGVVCARLSPIAGDIARLARAGGTMSWMLNTLEAHFGRFEEMPDQVRDTMQSLIELGVVRIS